MPVRFQARLRRPEISAKAAQFREKFASQKLVIGIDRLDYTKGIPDRLEAFRLMLEGHPEWRNKVSLIQITVPSRESVPEYERLRRRIQQLVGEINGEFTSPGERVPIHYLHRALKREDVFAVLRAADVGIGHTAARRDEPGGQGVLRLQC